jgi:hypothetical protein
MHPTADTQDVIKHKLAGRAGDAGRYTSSFVREAAMNKAIVRCVLIILLVAVAHPIYAQPQKAGDSLGWDLTYASVLKRNKVEPNEWVWKWLGRNYQSPIKPLIARWRGEPIISSVLIESPSFHAGEHVSLWLVRTKDHAYYWELIEGKPPGHAKEPLSPQLYDEMLKTISTWQQAEPLKPEDTPPGAVPGYIGFLSIYDRNVSRQMLLSLLDFYLMDNKNPEEAKGGRLALAIDPVIAGRP